MEVASNCSWSDAGRYLNISVPDSHCVTLSGDFRGIFANIPFEIVPEEFVETLETSSMEYSCCSSDNSLLISNWSNTQCLDEPESQFRISQIYNGECFVLGNEEDIIQDSHQSFDENDPETYVYIMRWQCNSFQDDCDDIPIMDEQYLPQTCSTVCVESEEEQEEKANQGFSGGNFKHSSTSNSDKIATVVAVIGAVIAIFMIIVVGYVVYGRKKAMQGQIEANVSANINRHDVKHKKKLVKGDDKYEAFVSDVDQQDMNVVRVAEVGDAADYSVQ